MRAACWIKVLPERDTVGFNSILPRSLPHGSARGRHASNAWMCQASMTRREKPDHCNSNVFVLFLTMLHVWKVTPKQPELEP